MKKLLNVLAVSTLVGTSASNLKPIFANAIVSNGFKSNQKNNKDISIKNQNDKKPFDKLIIKENFPTSSIFSLLNGAIYVGTKNQGLWKSTDGINFNQVKGIPNDLYINDIVIAPFNKENKKNIITSNYDDIFYGKNSKLLGKKWTEILLSSKDILQYHKKIRDYFPFCKQKKLIKTLLDDLFFWFDKNMQKDIIEASEINDKFA